MKQKLERATVIATNMLVTFVQAGLSTWIATGASTDKLGVSAFVGAGSSAVWNIMVKPYLKTKGWLK